MLAGLPALAADPDPAEAAQLINEVRQRVAGCGDMLRAGMTPVSSGQAHSGAHRPPLSWNSRLAAAAEQHARSMAENAFFDHRGLDGSRVGSRTDAAGYRWRSVGENLAAGQRTLEDAVQGWLLSEGHCRNLLDERFAEFGLARVVSQRPNDRYRVYWALVLARPAGVVLRTASAD
jgi:hypothetical protein